MFYGCSLLTSGVLTLLVGRQKEHPTSRTLSDEVLAWLGLSICSKWFAYGPAAVTATPSSLAALKSRMVWPSWCRLTQVVLENRSLTGVCLFAACWNRDIGGVLPAAQERNKAASGHVNGRLQCTDDGQPDAAVLLTNSACFTVITYRCQKTVRLSWHWWRTLWSAAVGSAAKRFSCTYRRLQWHFITCTVFTHRRSKAERGACFQRRLFVCLSVCLSTR